MIRRLAACLTILAAILVPATESLAEPVCNDRAKVLSYLSGKYGEVPVAMGLAANGSVLEVLASDKGSWTIILTSPRGFSCVVASGKAWEELERKVWLGPKL